ncbi:hypothetical protein [Thermocrinis sp.]|jgi:hypothetical protein|uniref:hypothetical protein n=1 Tax=Thermocrinis sp. TaxID=2024383 RepID=UPI003C0EDC5C
MKALTEAKALLETLKAITSDFLMAKFVEVAEVEGFEFKVPLYSKYYEFKQTEERVPYDKVLNSLRVRLYSDEGCVSVYGIKDEPFIYLVEVELRGRIGKRVNLEMVKLHYYVGEDEPDREPLGYIRVGSDSIIGLMTDRQACDLVDVLARFRNWMVCL